MNKMSNALRSIPIEALFIGVSFPFGFLDGIVTDNMDISLFLTGGLYMAVPGGLGGYLRSGSLETAVTKYSMPLYTGYIIGELAGNIFKNYVLR